MSTTTVMLLCIAAFLAGGLCGVVVMALAVMSRESSAHRPVVDARGLHPLEEPTH